MVQMKKSTFGSFLVKKMSSKAPKVIFGAFEALRALLPLLLVIIFAPDGIEKLFAIMAVIAAQLAALVVGNFHEFSDSRALDIPVPSKRFTVVTGDDMVSIDSSRLQELLVYTSELEDWLDSKGYCLNAQNASDDVDDIKVDNQ